MVSLVSCPKCGKNPVSSEGTCPKCSCNVAVELRKRVLLGRYICDVCYYPNSVHVADRNCVECGHPIPSFCGKHKVFAQSCPKCKQEREAIAAEKKRLNDAKWAKIQKELEEHQRWIKSCS